MKQEGNENWAKIRDEMGLSMEEGCGIYRTPELMQKTIDKLARELKERFKRVNITDNSSVFNTDLLYTIELGYGTTSRNAWRTPRLTARMRSAHQRLDEGCTERATTSTSSSIRWRSITRGARRVSNTAT
ncbi:hypothetical protein M8494_36740 [Serratia ureilytica]